MRFIIFLVCLLLSNNIFANWFIQEKKDRYTGLTEITAQTKDKSAAFLCTENKSILFKINFNILKSPRFSSGVYVLKWNNNIKAGKLNAFFSKNYALVKNITDNKELMYNFKYTNKINFILVSNNNFNPIVSIDLTNFLNTYYVFMKKCQK